MARLFAIATLVVCLWSAEFTWNCCAGEARAGEVNRIIKIAAQDQSVLVESGAGVLRVVHVGDSLAPYGQVQSIDQTRIVFKNAEAETLIITFINGEQMLQRVSKTGSSPHMPLVKTITNGGDGAVASEAAGAVRKAGGEEKN